MKTKLRIWTFQLILMGLVIIVTNSCKKQTDQVQPPVIITFNISSTKLTTANCGGDITDDGGAKVTARGVCWSTIQNPTITDSKTTDGTGTGTFLSAITGLTATTHYYIRAYATNSAGTGYGDEISFKTYTGSVNDVDGNVYGTETIGNQTWMAENLKTTRYRNGDLIGTTAPATLDITNESTPKYQWATDGDEGKTASFGRLYTWYAVMDSRNVCPTGWHLPTGADLLLLITYLGGESVAGGKLKESGTFHFTLPNTGATNETGFTALPGGARHMYSFDMLGKHGGYWSSTEQSTTFAYERFVSFENSSFSEYSNDKKVGISVRCLKD